MPNEETELLPCPFCGGKAERFTIQDEPTNRGGDVISCPQCGASSHVEFERKENLVSAWNTRAAAMGWRDIASAPRDGTMFLGWHGGVGFWHWQDGTPPSRKTGWRNYMWVYPENEGPTHWMPLPTPPEPTT